jgi:hypothetical protein
MGRLAIGALFLTTMLVIVGCSLDVEIRKLAEYKLKDGNSIELIYRGGGATAPDYIEVKKKGSDSIIEDLKGFNDKYIFSFHQLNDSLLNVTLTDTAYFTGQHANVIINMNKRVNGYWNTSQEK